MLGGAPLGRYQILKRAIHRNTVFKLCIGSNMVNMVDAKEE